MRFRFPPAEAWPVVVLLMVLSGALAYFIGIYALRVSVHELEIMDVRQGEQIEELMRRNEALMVDRTMAERRLEVSNQTLEYLWEMLQTSEAELRKIREEIELFRKITGPNREEKLSIHTLKVFVTGENGRWGYRLVLYQGDFSNIAEGRYDLVLHGHAEGSPGQYRLSDLAEDSQQQSFSFRHFVALSGEFKLPERFEVERVEVEASPSDKKLGAINKSFSWRRAMSDPG
ncbi:MAG: hypothetical protein OXC38_08965 [Gammaproteobacteria bacterium]|nr:hypothetical protein [Gammaproteobacteria bacterium]